MKIPAGLSPERFNVAVVTSGLAAEQFVSTRRGGVVERNRGLRCRNRELIELQCSKFGSDEVIVGADVRQIAKSVCGRDGELGSVVESRIEESSLSVHLKICHERVPVRHRATPDQ